SASDLVRRASDRVAKSPQVAEIQPGRLPGRCWAAERSAGRPGGPGGILMGEPDTRYWINRGAVALLGCECGEVGCWPLNAQVFHDGGLVTWRGFAQPFR